MPDYRINPHGWDHDNNRQLFTVEYRPDGKRYYGPLAFQGKPAAYHDEALAKAHLKALNLAKTLEQDKLAVQERHDAAWAAFWAMAAEREPKTVHAPASEEPAPAPAEAA